jgi:predicted phosphodiesterase
MAGVRKQTGKIILEYLEKYPKLPNLTLAKKIYKDHPLQFSSVENIRSSIRNYTGQHGTYHRKTMKTNKHYDRKIEYELPQSHADPFETYEIKQTKTLIISDLHIPYQDNNAIKLALDYGKKHGATCILINGDLIDFATISRFDNDWRFRSVAQEFEAVRLFLTTLRKAFPKAKIVLKEGNHDLRWEKWLFLKAPEIFDDPEFKLEVRLRLGELGIDIVKDKRPIKLGKLTVLHGHELPGMGGVNPARATFMKTLENVLVGHYHRSSKHSEPTMHGHMIVTKSTGCLCGLNPGFLPINKWNHGFAFCELDLKTGDYMLDILDIIKGKIYK